MKIITSGLVNGSFSLPKWQAVKMIFFAPCITHTNLKPETERGVKYEDNKNQTAFKLWFDLTLKINYVSGS